MIPDQRKTLRNGAIKTIRRRPGRRCQDDLLQYAGEAGIPRDTAWSQLTEAQRDWVINGTPDWKGKWNKQWYGIKRFFEYLESKAYKMHIRVLLSKYRSYTPCHVVRRRAAEDRGAAVARWATRPAPTRCCPPGNASCRSVRGLVAQPAGSLAGAEPARPDADADRPAAAFLR